LRLDQRLERNQEIRCGRNVEVIFVMGEGEQSADRVEIFRSLLAGESPSMTPASARGRGEGARLTNPVGGAGMSVQQARLF